MRGSRSGDRKCKRRGEGVGEVNKWRTLSTPMVEVGGEWESRREVGAQPPPLQEGLQVSAPLCTKLPDG